MVEKMAQKRARYPPSMYTVGWVSGLSLEQRPARAMLDEEHLGPLERASNDHNSYICGRIAKHYVVMACLPAGKAHTTSATIVSERMLSTFPSVKIGLLVGVGGGAPSLQYDIRLGDIVVSQPSGCFGGVVQYDRGKARVPDFFERTGHLNSPPDAVLNTLSTLQSRLDDPKFPEILEQARQKYETLRTSSAYPGVDKDVLHESAYSHIDGEEDCRKCLATKVVKRQERIIDNPHCPQVFYGTIGSGNSVIRDPMVRDRAREELGILCFEMEAAGLMNNFPCLVVRGICNYADSHKNDLWQGYAASVAAAYAKEFLLALDAQATERTAPAKGTELLLDPRYGHRAGDFSYMERSWSISTSDLRGRRNSTFL